jgi:hypothetical protein
MALIKSFEVKDTGATATYWRITHVQADFTAAGDGEAIGSAEVLLHGYVSAEARLAGKQPIMMKRIPFTSEQFGGSFDGVTRGMIYFGLKQHPDFIDAVDALDDPNPEPDAI